MGLFDIFKKKKCKEENFGETDNSKETSIGIDNLTDLEKKKIIEVLKNILLALHEKRYNQVINYVDESKIEDLEDFLSKYIQGTLDVNNYGSIDEYGVECNFHPRYEYAQISIYKYNNKDFILEYDLTSDGELIDLVLQLDFIHTKDGLKCIFENIDPQ